MLPGLHKAALSLHPLRLLFLPKGGRMQSASVKWIGEQKFVATSPSGHAITLDSDRESNQATGRGLEQARNPVPSARPARRYRRQARHPAQRRQILLGRRNAQENGRAVLALRDFGPCYLSQRGRPPTCSILPTGAAKRNLAIPLKRLEPATAQEPFGARAASARPALT